LTLDWFCNSYLPSVLWHCRLGIRKNIETEWWGVDVVICLEHGTDCLHVVQLMPVHPKACHLLARLNPDWFWLSCTGLSRLFWKIGSWTGVVAVVVNIVLWSMNCHWSVYGRVNVRASLHFLICVLLYKLFAEFCFRLVESATSLWIFRPAGASGLCTHRLYYGHHVGRPGRYWH